MKKNSQDNVIQFEPELESTESKIFFWLEKYWKPIATIVGIIVAAWLFILIVSWFRGKQIERYAQKFAQQKSATERLQWAESSLPHGLDGLKGFVFLETANEAFKNKDFEKALQYYEKAKAILSVSPLAEHAQLGYAFSAIYAKDLNKAERMFSLLQYNHSGFVKAQALYGLAYIACQNKNADALESNKEKLKSLPEAESLQVQIDALKI